MISKLSHKIIHFWQLLQHDRRFVTAVPFGWLGLFFLVPFLIIIKISFSQTRIAIPPFQPLWQWAKDGQLRIQIYFQAYAKLFTDPFYVEALLNSLLLAAIATLICLGVGYMMAYAISRAQPRWRTILMLLIILPFWTSYLIRVYAWIGLLNTQGIFNKILLTFGWIDAPLLLIYNSFSVTLGLVYCYLPFMILPIYATLLKINPVYLEAAYDLGCRPWRAFWTLTVPLSMPGIIAGCILVFIPTVGEYVIPELLGGSKSLMLGRVIWMEFFNNRDWPMACALTVVMLTIFVIPVIMIQRAQLPNEEYHS
ncbi:MAG: ABC transporter permease subunit [Alphaproteobacteria bacterium]